MTIARCQWMCLALLTSVVVQGQTLDDQAKTTLRKAANYYHDHVARHGGYVYHYSLDLKQRWGEGVADDDQIWVQPPGTPTVGLAFLNAYRATKELCYLHAATDAANALVQGQLKSGGWTNSINFDSQGRFIVSDRNKRRKKYSSLDDGQTQSAIQLLVRADAAHETKHRSIHEASLKALDALLAAQFPNGGFPQVWTGPVDDQPIREANYPEHDWRTEERVKNYWDMYTLNDNVAGYVADTLIVAHETYHDAKYLNALRKLGDFLLLAQMPEPQPAWAQQYNYAMQPIWARKFEPPGISGDETQEVLDTLITIAYATGDDKYLATFPIAMAWLRRSILSSGEVARYYELKSNRPLYMTRVGDQYILTYDDSRLPDHYGWTTPSQIETLEKKYALVQKGKRPVLLSSPKDEMQAVQDAIRALDTRGRWVSTYNGETLIGQLKLPIGTRYLASQVFATNLNTLSNYLRKDH